ncbi:MAG: sigma 54-interacting transcriptional regulator [Zoogloeaceae bacterium]|jgi:transcriptional regulator with PAS, ATPase and Fis domain|nr:sigma 54-interacting transcriptional regulator [Zoogloeaceae bacterium]
MVINKEVRALFDAMSEGIVYIDHDGRIVFVNRAYRRFLEMENHINPDQRVEGLYLRELRPNAQLPDVVKNELPVLHVPRKEQTDIYFVNMYPVSIDGKIVGGLSVVTFIEEARNFKPEIESFIQDGKQNSRPEEIQRKVPHTFASITAVAPLSMAVKRMAMRIADTDATVLLESESGTGKELYAQAIHNASRRRDSMFLAINCANFSKDILESELFGYEDGAFTGARKGGKKGFFEAAHGGTVFLDEVSEMELSLQAKLLRVLQEHRVRRIGGVEEISVDVRIIAACNADLLHCVEERKFRNDLYFRLNVFPLRIPALRERTEEISLLAKDILADMSRRLKQKITINDQAMKCLMAYHWPGNIRELRNVLEFSSYLTVDGIIDISHLPENCTSFAQSDLPQGLAAKVRAFEREEISKLLHKYGSDTRGKQKAANILGISLATLYNKLGIVSENGK